MELKLNNTLWSRILLIAPFFLWGAAMVAMKQVIPHTNPLFLAAVRLIPAGFLVYLTFLYYGDV